MGAAHSNLNSTLTALADPTRRAILERLATGETCVTEIARPFAMSLNAVSKHIRVLERARLVRRRRAGREHFLSFSGEPLTGAVAWIARQRVLQAEDRATGRVPRKKRSKGESR